jgi:DNA recombination protein RmuC
MPGLIESGVGKGVILATPTTLITLLKTVAYGWQQETAAENAKNIIALGRELLDRLNLMGDHLNRLGRDLDRSTATYNRLVGSFERRVFASARKFRDLGISQQENEDLPRIEPLEKRPRLTDAAPEKDPDT